MLHLLNGKTKQRFFNLKNKQTKKNQTKNPQKATTKQKTFKNQSRRE